MESGWEEEPTVRVKRNGLMEKPTRECSDSANLGELVLKSIKMEKKELDIGTMMLLLIQCQLNSSFRHLMKS